MDALYKPRAGRNSHGFINRGDVLQPKRCLLHRFLQFSFILFLLKPAQGMGELRSLDPEDRSGDWSMGFAYFLDVPVYAGEVDLSRDFRPTFVYTGKRIFMDSTEFGWHAIDTDEWQLDISGSYFVEGYNDHTFVGETGGVRPERDPLKGMERKNALEASVELTRKTNFGRFGIELRQDASGVHNGAELRGHWAKVVRGPRWQLEPWVEYSWLSAEKASYYFGVKDDEVTDERPAYSIDASRSLTLGLAGRYRLQNQHHLNINLAYRTYGGDLLNSPTVKRDGGATVQLGYRYELGASRYADASDNVDYFSNNDNSMSVRLGTGCTNDTRFIDVLGGDIDCSYEGTGLASLFVARKLSNEMFTLPVEAWFQTGIARRLENDLQDDFWEGVLAIKALFRRFPWRNQLDTRLGFSNGISYAASVPAIETEKAEEKNRRTSHLLHYLEFSFDLSIGDLLNVDRLRNGYIGIYVHHRSGIFGNSDFYNNVYGGSNTNGLYFEWEFK
jgi:outer membrane protein